MNFITEKLILTIPESLSSGARSRVKDILAVECGAAARALLKNLQEHGFSDVVVGTGGPRDESSA